MRAISTAVAALVVALGAGSWLAFHDVQHPVRRKAPRASVATVNISAPVSLVERISVPGEATRHSMPARPAPSGSPRRSETPLQDTTYHELFAADAPSVSESWKYQNAIRAELAKLPRSSVSVESFDCHARLCKAQLLFDSTLSDLKTMKDVFMNGAPADFPNGFGALAAPTREYLPDGKVRTTLYLAREGEMVVASDDASDP